MEKLEGKQETFGLRGGGESVGTGKKKSNNLFCLLSKYKSCIKA